MFHGLISLGNALPSITSHRFAVKEAAYKALYPVARPTWKELTFLSFGSSSPGSKPKLDYTPMASLGSKVPKLHVSVSHDGEYIAATVLAEDP